MNVYRDTVYVEQLPKCVTGLTSESDIRAELLNLAKRLVRP